MADFLASKMAESISLGRLYVTAFRLISRISAMRTRTPASDSSKARICEDSSASRASSSWSMAMNIYGAYKTAVTAARLPLYVPEYNSVCFWLVYFKFQLHTYQCKVHTNSARQLRHPEETLSQTTEYACCRTLYLTWKIAARG